MIILRAGSYLSFRLTIAGGQDSVALPCPCILIRPKGRRRASQSHQRPCSSPSASLPRWVKATVGAGRPRRQFLPHACSCGVRYASTAPAAHSSLRQPSSRDRLCTDLSGVRIVEWPGCCEVAHAPQRLLCRVAKGEAEVPNDSLQARFSPKPPRLEKKLLVSVALFRGRPVFRKVRDQFRVPLEPHIPKLFLT